MQPTQPDSGSGPATWIRIRRRAVRKRRGVGQGGRRLARRNALSQSAHVFGSVPRRIRTCATAQSRIPCTRTSAVLAAAVPVRGVRRWWHHAPPTCADGPACRLFASVFSFPVCAPHAHMRAHVPMRAPTHTRAQSGTLSTHAGTPLDRYQSACAHSFTALHARMENRLQRTHPPSV